MPSFDIVSKVAVHEVTNAIDQANREVKARFDFKDSNANFAYQEDKITLTAPSKFQLQQMITILDGKLTKRNINLSCLDRGNISETLNEAKQIITIKQGINHELGKKISKAIKDSKLKVQATNMENQIRVTGKKRDDLQDVIALLRKTEFELPLQFENFRD
jgi:cyclic-di-GMP-binding protein